jgi:hypothetical protein
MTKVAAPLGVVDSTAPMNGAVLERRGRLKFASFLPVSEKIFPKVCISTAIDGETKKYEVKSMKYEVGNSKAAGFIPAVGKPRHLCRG